MGSLKFIHCADVHLEAPFKEVGTGNYAANRRKDIRRAFLNILEAVKRENSDFLLISGDLFEHRYVNKSTMEWLSLVMSEVSVPIVIIAGNHDPYILNSWYKVWNWPSNVHILTNEKPYLRLDKEKVFIYGLGFSSFTEGKPDLTKVSKPVDGFLNILMLHCTLDLEIGNELYMPISSSELEKLNYNYYALGHFHNQRTDFTIRNAYNPGSPEPLGFDEPGKHGAFLVTAAFEGPDIKLEVKGFKTSVRCYHSLNIDVTGLKSMEEVKMKVLGALEGKDPQSDILSITLKGRSPLQINSKMLTELFSENWFYLKIINETENDYDLEALAKDSTLTGAFVRETLERINRIEQIFIHDKDNTDLKVEKEKLERALYFGLEVIKNGSIEWWDE